MAPPSRSRRQRAPPEPALTTQGRRPRKEQEGRSSSKRSDLRYKEIRHLLARKEREKRDHAETIIEEL